MIPGSNSNNERIPELDPPLDSAVCSVVSEPLDAQAIDRVKQRALSFAGDVTQTDASVQIRPPRHSSLFARALALAAAIAIVVTGTLWLQKPSSAYGAVIEQLRTAGAFKYVMEIFIDGQAEPVAVRVMVARDGRQRHEQGEKTVSILDASNQLRLTLSLDTKQALVPHDSPNSTVPVSSQLRWFEELKSRGTEPDEQLGEKILNGRKVKGFVANLEQYSYTLWIATDSKELVQMEHGALVEGSSIKKVVMRDFQFNVELDDALFSFAVPEGYKTIKRPAMPEVSGGEASIVEALKGFTKLSGGKFPRSIADWGEWAVAYSQNSTDGKLSEEATKVMSHLGSILPFLSAKRASDYEYLGAGIKVDDPRCIVFWHRLENKKIRAIFNDLSVADIKPEDLP